MDFIILKVNGQDLRNATHEQAIRTFLQAKEPILVEVSRREVITPNHGTITRETLEESSVNSRNLSVGVQTEWNAEEVTLAAMTAADVTSVDIRNALRLQNNGIPSVSGLLNIIEMEAEEEDEQHDEEDEEAVLDNVDEIMPRSLFPVRLPDCNSDILIYDDTPVVYPQKCLTCTCREGVNENFDRVDLLPSQRLIPEQMDYEQKEVSRLHCLSFAEVLLSRISANDKFGLTLGYRKSEVNNDVCEIYIEEIEPNSVASRMDDVRVGDRVVKINDELVQARQSVTAIFNENPKSVKLLLARNGNKEMSTRNKICPLSQVLNSVDRYPVSEELLEKDIKKCNECKRADQDSGLGRTTDESARTEESSEQEVDSDQRSSGKNFCVNSTNGKGAFSENVGSHLHDRMREASTTCIPMNSIDEELVFLGRLMQSLAVHCRHLVQAKMSCRSGSLRYSPRPEHSADSCDVAYSQGSFKMGHTYNSISVEKEQWLPSMSSSSSSVNRGSGDGISVNQRVPRMGTRGLEHTNNTGETSNLLKNQETIEGQKQDPMNILRKETDTFLQYGGDTAVYPLDLDKQLSLSGQTSAYCTGESVRSQHTTNGVSIRLRQLTKEPSRQFGNSDDNDGADVWNGELTASLSDLGGSILSLAATVSSVPNLFPNNSESIMASHLPCESLSPASNWSIDGSSQSHQRCIATPVSTPVASGRSLNDQQIHSDDSRDGLARIPSISECDSSGINRSRPSGLSNISSSDSLSVTEDKIGDPLRQVQRNRFISFTGQKHGENDQTATECYPLKTPLELRDSSVHDTRLHIGFGVDAESVRITGQAGSKPVSYRPPADPRSKQRIRPREGSTHGNKKNNSCVHRQLPPTPPQQVCNEMTSTALQPRQSGYLSSNDQSRALPSFLSPQINTNHHMNQKPCVISPRIIPSCSHSKISSNPLICVTTTTSCLFENAALSQSNHRYDFYDRFCSPSRIRNSSDSHKFGNDLMKSTKGCAQRDFSSAPTAFSGCGSKAKTEDQVASDIYEIPYASVTLEDTAISYVEGRLPNALGQPVDVNQLCLQSSIRPEQSINRNGHISGAYVSSIVNRCVDCHVPPLTTPSTSDFGQHRSSPRTPCCVPDECPKFPINFRECHQFHGNPPLPYMTENLNVMEWVIKKRPDGTRYITRRPIRNRLLKERAKRVAEERSVLTTDDDVPGDLKTGRQLNRTDRRKQADKDRRDRSKKRTTNPSQSSNVADKHGESQIRPESADINGSQNITTV